MIILDDDDDDDDDDNDDDDDVNNDDDDNLCHGGMECTVDHGLHNNKYTLLAVIN